MCLLWCRGRCACRADENWYNLRCKERNRKIEWQIESLISDSVRSPGDRTVGVACAVCLRVRSYIAACAVSQEIVMDPAFAELRDRFVESHCAVFDDCDENKLEYTPLFQGWTAMIARFSRSLMSGT